MSKFKFTYTFDNFFFSECVSNATKYQNQVKTTEIARLGMNTFGETHREIYHIVIITPGRRIRPFAWGISRFPSSLRHVRRFQGLFISRLSWNNIWTWNKYLYIWLFHEIQKWKLKKKNENEKKHNIHILYSV